MNPGGGSPMGNPQTNPLQPSSSQPQYQANPPSLNPPSPAARFGATAASSQFRPGLPGSAYSQGQTGYPGSPSAPLSRSGSVSQAPRPPGSLQQGSSLGHVMSQSNPGTTGLVGTTSGGNPALPGGQQLGTSRLNGPAFHQQQQVRAPSSQSLPASLSGNATSALGSTPTLPPLSNSSSLPSQAQPDQQQQGMAWQGAGTPQQGSAASPTHRLGPTGSTQALSPAVSVQNRLGTPQQQQALGKTQTSPALGSAGGTAAGGQGPLPGGQVASDGTAGIGTTMSRGTDAGIPPAPAEPSVLEAKTIKEILHSIDPSVDISPEVEEALLDIADDFIHSVTAFSCQLARHRKAQVLEPKDVILHLERNWNMRVPGFPAEEFRVYKRPAVSELHKQRLASVRRTAVSTPEGSSAPQAVSHHQSTLQRPMMSPQS